MMKDKSVSTDTHKFLDIKEEHCNDTVHKNFDLSIKLEPLDEEVHIKEEDVPIENISGESINIKAEPGLVLKHFENKYNCVICHEMFDLQTVLNVHLMTHTGDKPFTCSLCAKQYRQRSQLYIHLIAHCSPGYKDHYCAKCSCEFPSLADLREHSVTHTRNRVSHKCYVCGIQFNGRSKLSKHLLTHDICLVCDRRFPGLEELEWHLDVHVKKLQNRHNISNGMVSYIIAQDLEAIKNQSVGNPDNYLQDSDTAVIKDEFDS